MKMNKLAIVKKVEFGLNEFKSLLHFELGLFLINVGKPDSG